MIKRIFAVLLILAAVGGAALYYFQNKPEPVVDSVFRAVPLDAALLIDIKDYHSLSGSLASGKSFWEHLSKLPLFDEIDQRFRFIDSVGKAYPQIRALLSAQHPILLSGHPVGKEEIEYIYYIRVEEEKDFNTFNTLLSSMQGKALEYSTRKYEGATIQDISFAANRKDNFSFAWSHGLLVISKSSILLEKVIRQLSAKESLLDKPGLNEIVKTAGKSVIANFYLNFDYFPAISLKLIQTKYRKELNFIRNFGSWLELDLDAKPDILILNGFSTSNTAKQGFETLFRNQKPLKFEAFSKIPSSANTFAILGISKIKQYVTDFETFLDATGSLKERTSIAKSLKDNYNLDVTSSFSDLFDQEAGIVFLENGADTFVNQAFSFIKTKSDEDAAKLLNNLANDYVSKNNLKITDVVTSEKIDKDQELKIWTLPHVNIPAVLFGNMFSAGSNQVCAMTDNYIIFGNNRNALVQYFKTLNQNGSISNDLDFTNLSEFFSTESNFFFYNKPTASASFYPNFLRNELMESLTKQQVHLNSLNVLVYQFNSGQNSLIYHNLLLRFGNGTNKSAGGGIKPVETQLDGKLASKPFVFKVNKESFVFVQDEKNQVYLINNNGRILWKVGIAEPILGEVYQIDFYKNGKQQLLFNTRTKIYILDKNGTNIEKFPVTLHKPATNGLAMFDYDKNRDYRIFIAGTDHKIYLLDKKGEQVDQWSSRKTDTDVTQPIQHFRAGGKDYIVFNDHKHVYVVNRKGKEIISVEAPSPLSDNKVTLVNPKSKKEIRFVASEANGKVLFINLDEKVKELDLGKIPENHWFDVYDIDNNGTKDLIVAWDIYLKVFSQDGKALHSISTTSAISCRPNFYELSKDTVSISIVTGGDNKVYLYNKDGNALKGFPLKGNTQFSVDVLKNSQNRFNLTVGGENNLLYQYPVQ